MKTKLTIILLLTLLSLAGIIVFQAYWGFNAYKQNKKIFEAKIDTAMQQAMDSCKRDYFDSIRVVLVRRFSDAATILKIDSSSQPDASFFYRHANLRNDTINRALYIGIAFYGATRPNWFETDLLTFNHYKTKLGITATTPEVLVEMAFNNPLLLTSTLQSFSQYDTMVEFTKYQHDHHGKRPPNMWLPNHTGTYNMPRNYKQADSLRISNYLHAALSKMRFNTGFELKLGYAPSKPQKSNLHYSETSEYKCQYHGFTFLLNDYAYFRYTLYARAAFHNPQSAVLRGMQVILGLSGLLVLFTLFCFYYIIKTLRQQKALGELKDDFINNMTHELKTPIATIAVAIEGLQKFNALNDPDKTQRYLQTSRNQLARLNELVNKVLDVAAFENKELKLIKEKLNVDELLADLIAAERSKAEKTITITFNNNAGINTITADKLHFKNVLINILDNAVKYNNEPVVIDINIVKSQGDAVFTIKDNGIGIHGAHLNRIFEKFYRVPTGNIHNIKGTGLGLNYVKYIVEAHGGTVRVKSEVNAGTEFIVSIPL